MDSMVAGLLSHARRPNGLRRGAMAVGARLNIEIDMLARYVARMIGADAPGGAQNG